MNTLPEIGSWSSGVTITTAGEDSDPLEYQLELIDVGTQTFGTCTFEVWQVRETLEGPDGARLPIEKTYLPEIGVVVAQYSLDADGARTGGVAFTRIKAE